MFLCSVLYQVEEALSNLFFSVTHNPLQTSCFPEMAALYDSDD